LRQALQLLGACAALRARVLDDRVLPGFRVGRVEIIGNALTYLPESGKVAHYHRDSKPKRFHQGQSETLGLTWEQQCACGCEMAGKIIIGAISDFLDMAAKMIAGIENMKRLLSLPAPLADYQ
jgi:hypothetical protein